MIVCGKMLVTNSATSHAAWALLHLKVCSSRAI
jgi:hypothetical protein